MQEPSAVVELDPVREQRDGRVRGLSLDAHDVHLLDLEARVREAMRELPSLVSSSAPVVYASSRPTGTTRARAADELDDRRPSLRVARRRDHGARLVQQDVAQGLRADRPAVDLDEVALVDHRVEPPRHPVDLHAARLDQRVCAAAGGEPCTCEMGVEAHGDILPPVPCRA